MNTFRHISITFVVSTCMVLFLYSPSVYGISDVEDVIVVEGTVVAKYVNALSYFCQDGWDKEIIIIVRIERRINGNEPHQYVRVHYPYTCGITDPLPVRIYNAKRFWRFTLTRSQKCNGPLKGELYPSDDPTENDQEPIPRIHRTPHAEKELIPFDINMHCYLLRPYGFMSLREGKSGENRK